MNQRNANKELSLKRILESAAIRLRENGLSGAGIASIMKDAGLTHGAFYAHFPNKAQLINNAFEHALLENRPRWVGETKGQSWTNRLKQLSKRYLTRNHRDNLSDSCALAALASDAARATPGFRRIYEKELLKSIDAICDSQNNPAPELRREEAIMFMALCIGGISLSRAVADKGLSERILAVCQDASERLTFRRNPAIKNEDTHLKKPGPAKRPPRLEGFPFVTSDKLRYADTDRQGHVNNAVFSTLLETGRVEILYNPDAPLYKKNCSFVIARQSIDFISELTWPGQVSIGTKVSSIGKSSIRFNHGLFQSGICAATAEVIIVHVSNETKKSASLAQQTRETLAAYLQ